MNINAIDTKTNKTMRITGKTMTLKVGDRKIQFLAQQDGDTGAYIWLTHYQSGAKFGNLLLAGQRLLKRDKPSRKLYDRANEVIRDRIKTFGLDRVMVVLNSTETIN